MSLRRADLWKCVFSHFLLMSLLALSLLLHPAPILSGTMLDPNQVSQLVWVGSELWIVPNRMWSPSLQGLPELLVQIMAMPRV